MVSLQPILSFGYFQLRKNKLPVGLKSLFYLSWEDAFWDILSKKNIKKGSKILLPNLYCGDVVKNIKLHGYSVCHYKVSKDLKTDKDSFKVAIKENNPAVVVIFHPVGIKSNLFENTLWLKKILNESILIEDSVHKIVDPGSIKLIKKNHFVIDSLRKVLPIQGSFLYGFESDLNFNTPNIFRSFYYSFKVQAFWLFMIIFWTLSNFVSDHLAEKLGKIAERLMLTGYELIGDSINPAKGFNTNIFFAERINIEKINKIKKRQVSYYKNNLKKYFSSNFLFSKNDEKNLKGFPIILPINKAEKMLSFLRRNGLLVRFELDDCDWSKKQKLIYLPLGIHISECQQKNVCNLFNKAFLYCQN